MVLLALLSWLGSTLPVRADVLSSRSAVHWRSARVRVFVDPEIERRFGRGAQLALSKAAQAWQVNASAPRIDLVPARGRAYRKLIDSEVTSSIGFARSWTFGDKLAVTVSTFDTQSRVMIAAKVWLNPHGSFQIDAQAREREPGHESVPLPKSTMRLWRLSTKMSPRSHRFPLRRAHR